jgi:hypothetical protein
MKNKIKEINAMLKAIEVINSFTNDGKTYKIALLNKINDNFADTFRDYFNEKRWGFSFTQKNDWQSILKRELVSYFGQYILYSTENVKITNEYNVEYLLNLFIEKIENLLPANYTFHTMKVHWSGAFYECYENDYLFDLKENVLFLHFGSSD